jgi:hypothetical protein
MLAFTPLIAMQTYKKKLVTIYPDNRDWMIGELNACIFKYCNHMPNIRW